MLMIKYNMSAKCVAFCKCVIKYVAQCTQQKPVEKNLQNLAFIIGYF